MGMSQTFMQREIYIIHCQPELGQAFLFYPFSVLMDLLRGFQSELGLYEFGL